MISQDSHNQGLRKSGQNVPYETFSHNAKESLDTISSIEFKNSLCALHELNRWLRTNL